jgi:trigger factor
MTQAAQDSDRVTVDFEGKIDGEPFSGGKAEDFQFIVGEGQMLKEFEEAVRGMKAGESKTFPLAFPSRLPRQGCCRQDGRLPGHDQEDRGGPPARSQRGLAKSLGIEDGSVEGLRADIKKNLEREVKFRLLARNKTAVMDALVAKAELDLPKASVQAESSACSKAPVPSSSSAASRTPTRRRFPTTCSAPGRAPRAPGPGGCRTGAFQ